MEANLLPSVPGQVDMTCRDDEETVVIQGACIANFEHSNVNYEPVQFMGSNMNFESENNEGHHGPPQGDVRFGVHPEPVGAGHKGMQQTYFEPLRVNEEFPLMFSGQLCTAAPPSYFFPPLLYPGYPSNLENAHQDPGFLAQFTYRGGARMNPHKIPPFDNVIEYRQDIVLGSSFHPIWALDPARHFGQNIFIPVQPFVYTVVESVTHYCDQPYSILVNGAWVPGKAHMPLAHHICVCLDDGIKRYEEVIRYTPWHDKLINQSPMWRQGKVTS